MELRELHWAWIEQEARAGNLEPLAAELRNSDYGPMSDCGPIPVGVRALLADLARGKRPRKEKSKRIADRTEAEMLYLAQRALGASAGDAVAWLMDHYVVEHSTAYEAVSRVLAVGDKLAAFPKSQDAIPDDK